MANFLKQCFFPICLIVSLSILLFSSCASVQSPTGGPRDSIPPKVIKETPKNLTKNFNAKEVQIQFDEFIKLSNEFSEISISPAMDVLPEFKAKKQNLEIKFSQPLEANTTYTINFGKAITDVNESNILPNYTYVFATGNQIDSLSLSGTVTSSLTREKLKDVTVFILPLSQDSLFGKKRASFFTTTDTAGNFSLKNLREDTYRIYALSEQGGGDRIYNGQNEEIGFQDQPLVLNKNVENIQLQVFKAVPRTFSISERKIESDGRILLTFNKPLLKPSVKIIEPTELDRTKTFEITNTKDTAFIWLPEITFDSLKVSVSDADTPLDTITLRRNKRDTYNRVVLVSDNIIGPKLRPRSDVTLRMSAPIATAQEANISLLEDSVSVKYQISKQPGTSRTFNIKYAWKLNKDYILRFNENAFTDIFGNKSKLYIKRFNLDTEDNYGNISIKVIVPDTLSSYIVQWMGEKETIFRQDVISKNTTLNYLTYPTAKYRVRVIYDLNKNGIWDTGEVYRKQQPEKTWTFEKLISLRPNWDLEEVMTIPKPSPE
ncbi:Ig-like domain-containing domain [Daejeonella lutea]|uniref:Ig-like domain-containing protein n=1 Tax=Daejeonella lutea TaxID=572036 RepID=A0A1T5DMH0_9SPHI|nr:Ig-like domain-containing domain [Daejeonella lutea]SKB72815.1 Ig-like domain-containing protein [Daejeonella lutea]